MSGSQKGIVIEGSGAFIKCPDLCIFLQTWRCEIETPDTLFGEPFNAQAVGVLNEVRPEMRQDIT